MKKRILTLLLLPSLFGIASCGASSSNITYQVTLGENEFCTIYRLTSTTNDTFGEYASGYTLTQYGDSVFEITSGSWRAAYSNSKFGYRIYTIPA